MHERFKLGLYRGLFFRLNAQRSYLVKRRVQYTHRYVLLKCRADSGRKIVRSEGLLVQRKRANTNVRAVAEVTFPDDVQVLSRFAGQELDVTKVPP